MCQIKNSFDANDSLLAARSQHRPPNTSINISISRSLAAASELWWWRGLGGWEFKRSNASRTFKGSNTAGCSLCYKISHIITKVRQLRFPFLGIRFLFYKALVGECLALGLPVTPIDDPNSMQPTHLFTSLLAFTPTRNILFIPIILNMHSYKKLAVVALAASAITPALAAPTTYEIYTLGYEAGPSC